MGRAKVLVTGADQHQGLAVIRGLGLAGIPVVACGASRRSLGFYSRYAVERGRYTPPFESPQRSVDDLLDIIRRTGPALVIPAIESSLVLLIEARALIERHTRLAAPPPDVVEYAIDKRKTLGLAERLGVPVPRTVTGGSIAEILVQAAALTLPLAIKPRGHGMHPTTAHTLDFKVRYARTLSELRQVLQPFERDTNVLLVQEYASGVGRCVAAVCRNGEPLVQFAYSREREFPLSGGVSVLRKSVPLDDRLASHVTTMLREIGWHGVAMVEFKYDPAADRYTLMEINGRFQASTALALDAGVNLPGLVAALYGVGDLEPGSGYRVGVEERWLRGDLLALRDVFAARPGGTGAAPCGPHPSRTGVLWRFIRDFRPGVCYDEFKWHDWRPGVVEGVALTGMMIGWLAEVFRGTAGYVRRSLSKRARTLASSAMQRSSRV